MYTSINIDSGKGYGGSKERIMPGSFNLNNPWTYNGNISGMAWQTVQPTGVSTPDTTGMKAYSFSYDNLNRLLEGKYSEIVGSNWIQTNKYTEKVMSSADST